MYNVINIIIVTEEIVRLRRQLLYVIRMWSYSYTLLVMCFQLHLPRLVVFKQELGNINFIADKDCLHPWCLVIMFDMLPKPVISSLPRDSLILVFDFLLKPKEKRPFILLVLVVELV